MKPWFGPKLLGKGAIPTSWEGWLLTLLLVVAVVLIGRFSGLPVSAMLLVDGALVLLYLVIIALTYRKSA